MLYIIYGKDDYRCHEALEKIKKNLGDQEMLSVNTSFFDSRLITLSQLKDACNTIPFLSPARLIIVDGLLGQFEPQYGTGRRSNRSREKTDSRLKELQNLAEYINQMPPTTVLVLMDGELKNNNRLLKSLLQQAEVKRFARLGNVELGDWIQDKVKQGGGTIGHGAVDLLIRLIGGDLWTMTNEIDKLLAYSSGHSITEDDVKQLTSFARETSIFALTDAILEGRKKVAEQLLHQLLREGAAPPYILVMITRQLRLIVMAKAMGNRLFRPEIRNKLETTSDYTLDKALKQSKSYTLERVRRAYHKLLEADIAVKTGKYDNSELVLDLLVMELCQS